MTGRLKRVYILKKKESEHITYMLLTKTILKSSNFIKMYLTHLTSVMWLVYLKLIYSHVFFRNLRIM